MGGTPMPLFSGATKAGLRGFPNPGMADLIVPRVMLFSRLNYKTLQWDTPKVDV
jgi:hypothetical protein